MEPIIDVLVPQVVEEILETIRIIPQERVQQRTVEQVIDVRVPQVVEQVVEVVKIIPQERIQQRTVEQIQEIPVIQKLHHRSRSSAYLPTHQ